MIQFSLLWSGGGDPVRLEYIRQIPGVTQIVSNVGGYKTGEVWSLEALNAVKSKIEAQGLTWRVVESVPLHESIRLGTADRDQYIEAYQQTLRHLGQVGIRVLCYNFMPVFGWMRTDLAMPNEDGSTALAFSQAALAGYDFTREIGTMPDWAKQYTLPQLQNLLAAYATVTEEQLFQNFVYFLKAVVPVAEEAGVLLALHPDDPPWSIFGLPRIVRDAETIGRIIGAVDSPYNGITFCTGSLGANPTNDLPAMIRQFKDRIHFVHMRNVKTTGEKIFHETPHPTPFGDVDMAAVMKALVDAGYDGSMRPDHGRMIWGEEGNPGYGLYDRALGVMYLQGLHEAIVRGRY